ncbi:hypothetical protein KRP22_011560 [Phytophthora ramorum]|nr:hypothetical protein KRP22_10765 [Phytophthora ramorum]
MDYHADYEDMTIELGASDATKDGTLQEVGSTEDEAAQEDGDTRLSVQRSQRVSDATHTNMMSPPKDVEMQEHGVVAKYTEEYVAAVKAARQQQIKERADKQTLERGRSPTVKNRRTNAARRSTQAEFR